MGGYLAREIQAVQVQYRIKSLAVETAYSVKISHWDYLEASSLIARGN
jgi:hypothetical protein